MKTPTIERAGVFSGVKLVLILAVILTFLGSCSRSDNNNNNQVGNQPITTPVQNGDGVGLGQKYQTIIQSIACQGVNARRADVNGPFWGPGFQNGQNRNVPPNNSQMQRRLLGFAINGASEEFDGYGGFGYYGSNQYVQVAPVGFDLRDAVNTKVIAWGTTLQGDIVVYKKYGETKRQVLISLCDRLGGQNVQVQTVAVYQPISIDASSRSSCNVPHIKAGGLEVTLSDGTWLTLDIIPIHSLGAIPGVCRTDLESDMGALGYF